MSESGNANGIAWRELGARKASPLLLVRPLGGSMMLWDRFADALATERRVVMFDARASGASTGHARTSIADLANDACSVLDAREIDRADVFGISLGGMVATRFTLLFAERIGSLILASTAARGLAFERAGVRRAFGFATCCCHEAQTAERCLVRRVLSHTFRTEHPDETNRILDLAAASPSPRTTLVAHGYAALRHDARRELGTIRARTLILAGDRDHLLGARVGFDLARGIRKSQRIVIERSGHDLSLEQPEQTAARVLAFLRAGDA